jgi:tetraacyldisaccharide-1-P 4'-kinase
MLPMKLYYYRFSVVWLLVMALFPISALLLKFNRGRIQRARSTSLATVFLALVLVPVILVGNILIDPTTIG